MITWFHVLWYVFIALSILTLVNLILCIVVLAWTTGNISFPNVIVKKELIVGDSAAATPVARTIPGPARAGPSGSDLTKSYQATPYDDLSTLSYSLRTANLSVSRETAVGDFLQTSFKLPDDLPQLTANPANGYPMRIANPINVGTLNASGEIFLGNLTVERPEGLASLGARDLVVDSLLVQGNLSFSSDTSFLGNVTGRAADIQRITNLSSIENALALSAQDIYLVPVTISQSKNKELLGPSQLSLSQTRVYAATLLVSPEPELNSGSAFLDLSRGNLSCSRMEITDLQNAVYMELRADEVYLRGQLFCDGKQMIQVDPRYVGSGLVPYVIFNATQVKGHELSSSGTITVDTARLLYFDTNC